MSSINQDQIDYKEIDLDKINSEQFIEPEKEEKRFSMSFFYNWFNKTFRFNFKWRF